jgi:putative ABC transport system permease protein
MGLAFKIAWRNIWRHKGKSLVIGIILLFGSVLMTVGNGMISGMEEGLSANIVHLFTGDIIVVSDQQEKDDVLFSFGGKPLKVLKNYDTIKKTLMNEKVVEDFLPATAGTVFVFNTGTELGPIALVGVDIERYRKMFPQSFRAIEGRIFKPGEPGILISEEARRQSYNLMNFWLLPVNEQLDKNKLPADVQKRIATLDIRRDLVFMGASTSNTTVDIRVPVIGIIKYKSLNKIWGNYCIMDIESFREAHNYVTGDDTKVEINHEQKKLFESDNLDQMFSTGDVVDNTVKTDASFSTKEIQAQTRRTEQKYNPDAGSYNLTFLKLKKGVSLNAALQKLNSDFKKNHLEVRAVSWKKAVGAYGSMAVMVKGALNMFIMFIFFVAIIVIINTLSMAALERTAEIGMMRAIGARKSFLRKMFISETGLLAFFFGGIGIILGIIVIYLIKSANITTSNEILQLVYGGDKLNPLFTFGDLIIAAFELGIVTFLSVLYPLRVVGKIAPLDAIARE